MNVAIVGTGDIVESLARLAAAAGNTVTVGGARGPEGFASTTDLATLARSTDLLLLAMAPDHFRGIVRELVPGPASRAVVATRGLEPGTGKRLSEILVEESACLRVGALAGPILPGEVRRNSPCAAVVASPFTEVTRAASQALHSSACRIYSSQDLPGVELAGALVEVLAMALGIARGLGLGVGAQALIVTRGVAEGSRLARMGGGDPRTFSGLAGVGELVASAALPDHPGFVRGLALARGEADPAAAALCQALLGRVGDLPITQAVGALAAGKARAAEVITGLMTRDNREEFDA
ncbi:MAG: NAD(P)-binding domain-containing protein [Pseudomonadota bacterium]|nr:NAD(P)-binding domain-containing protein [Pseudomonadota bacterium]